MIKRLLTLFLLCGFCVTIQACSCQAWYEGLNEVQRQNCYKIEGAIEQQACLDKANAMTYGQYKKARADTIKGGKN